MIFWEKWLVLVCVLFFVVVTLVGSLLQESLHSPTWDYGDFPQNSKLGKTYEWLLRSLSWTPISRIREIERKPTHRKRWNKEGLLLVWFDVQYFQYLYIVEGEREEEEKANRNKQITNGKWKARWLPTFYRFLCKVSPSRGLFLSLTVWYRKHKRRERISEEKRTESWF